MIKNDNNLINFSKRERFLAEEILRGVNPYHYSDDRVLKKNYSPDEIFDVWFKLNALGGEKSSL